MPHKGRISVEEKAKAVEMYLAGEMGKTAIISYCGIGLTTFRDWLRLYEMRGTQGLMPASKWRKYSPDLKIQAVKEYLSGHLWAGSLHWSIVLYCKQWRVNRQNENGHLSVSISTTVFSLLLV